MVDVSHKDESIREAVAEGFIKLSKDTLEKLRGSWKTEKGDIIETARVAAILATKRVPEIIPHCHPIRISRVSVEISEESDGLRVRCSVKAVDRTGVEMEALTCVSVALLTIRDMVKKYEKDDRGLYPETEIRGIRVLEKIKRGF